MNYWRVKRGIGVNLKTLFHQKCKSSLNRASKWGVLNIFFLICQPSSIRGYHIHLFLNNAGGWDSSQLWGYKNQVGKMSTRINELTWDGRFQKWLILRDNWFKNLSEQFARSFLLESLRSPAKNHDIIQWILLPWFCIVDFFQEFIVYAFRFGWWNIDLFFQRS